MKMNGTNGKGCASPTFYVPKNGVYDENGQSSSELTYEFDEKITAPTYTFNTINQGSEYPHHNFQVQYFQTQQTPYVNYANAHSQADNGISDENERSPQFSPLGQRDIAEFMHRQEVRNKSSSGTSSSVNNEDDKSYQWKKSETETLSHEFGVDLPTTCLSSVSVANSFKQNISKALTTQRQQYQGIHPPRNEMGGTQLFAYENKRMIPPPPESPPPPAPKYYLDGHNRDKSLNYHSSLMENNEHYEITSEFSFSLCPSPHSLFPVQNDKIQLISQFAVTTEKQHEESEQQFKGTTVTNINDNNSQIFQSNNECSTNERSIYYSEFDSSDDEVQNQTVDSIGKGHEEMTINSKGNFSNFKQNFNSSNQQHYAVNTSFCLEKQTVVSRPLLLLNEHTIPNSPQSSFCVSLSPEEHASSTYAQVY
ncbi:unnamed protein product [Heterobilharzia americana]|nr:unnamed protein product [Heterobilharzia americana]